MNMPLSLMTHSDCFGFSTDLDSEPYFIAIIAQTDA